MPAGDVLFVLDNTAVSNFSAVGRMDILADVTGGDSSSRARCWQRRKRGRIPSHSAVDRGGLGRASTPLRRIRGAWHLPRTANRGFGLGEASSIATASSKDERWVFVSDDLDARREAGRRGVGVVGTYGILAREVAEGTMSLEEGNALLRRMIASGFRSHSDNLREESERLRSRR